jgi:hypothetical protein
MVTATGSGLCFASSPLPALHRDASAVAAANIPHPFERFRGLLDLTYVNAGAVADA